MPLITPTNVVLSAGAAAVAYGLWQLVYNALIVPYTTSVRFVPGPPNPSFLFGHLRDIFKSESAVVHEQWTETYGKTFRYKAILNVRFPEACRDSR